MAKICFYCGKELMNGQSCSCRTSSSTYSKTAASSSTGSTDTKNAKDTKQSDKTNRATKENERQAKERAKEQAHRFKQSQKAQRQKFDWRTFFMKLMTSSGYSSSDSLPRKIGYSLLQSLLRPMTAIDTFVQRQDLGLGVFYLALFSLSTGLASLRLFGYSFLTFVEGAFLGLVIALILNGLFILSFRFLSKMRFSLIQILSAFSAPSFFMSIFLLFAASGRTSMISFFLTIVTGIVAGALLQFLALKSLSKQSSDQLVVNVIFVYVVFFSIIGIIFSLLIPTSPII